MTRQRPFDLLCGLIALAIGRREPDAALVAAVAAPTIDWPRLVTLSGVHLLTPALGPALRHPSLRDSVPGELQDYLDAMLAVRRGAEPWLCAANSPR